MIYKLRKETMVMDYNYIRMRNALKLGDLEKAEEYKLLYESGKVKKNSVSVIDYVIAILVSVAILLGIYILHSEQKIAESQNTDTNMSPSEVLK